MGYDNTAHKTKMNYLRLYGNLREGDTLILYHIHPVFRNVSHVWGIYDVKHISNVEEKASDPNYLRSPKIIYPKPSGNDYLEDTFFRGVVKSLVQEMPVVIEPSRVVFVNGIFEYRGPDNIEGLKEKLPKGGIKLLQDREGFMFKYIPFGN